MAVPAKLGENQSPDPRTPGIHNLPEEFRPVCLHAAKLYGLGHSRKEIAAVIAEKLYGDREYDRETMMSQARARLRSWESRQWFRDLVWDTAVVELDMAGPQILRGVARKAKRGRVDAAKLALAITGRYKDKDDSQPAAVTINIANIPRPTRQSMEVSSEVAIESVEED